MFVGRRSALVQRALIVGTDEVRARRTQARPASGVPDLVVGFVDASPSRFAEVAGVPVLGGADELPSSSSGSDRPGGLRFPGRDRQMLLLMRHLQALGVQVDVVPRLFEALGPSVSLTSIEAMHSRACRRAD